MQVSLSVSTETVVSQLVASGDYSSPDDVVDAAVAMLDVQRKLEEGLQDIAAGRTAPLDMESIKEQVRTHAAPNG